MDGAGVTLHVVRAGEGPAVVLLHGFPEFWYSWRHQIDPLVDAGFSIIAPDMRGYNLSEKPRGVRAYRISRLVDDVVAIARGSGSQRIHLVGHDWGGVIAWVVAARHPELIDRLVILNAPHPALYRERIRRPPQMFMSWYVLFFQLPIVPELAFRANDHAAVRRIFRRSPWRADAFDADDIERYVEAISRPGALTSALNYYRATRSSDERRAAARSRVEAETMILWGERDTALDRSLLDGIETWAPRARIHRFGDVGHWIQNEAPAEVNRLLVDFIGVSVRGAAP
jgi:epoxide hydrolase 4